MRDDLLNRRNPVLGGLLAHKKSGQLCRSRGTEKAELTSESTEGAGEVGEPG